MPLIDGSVLAAAGIFAAAALVLPVLVRGRTPLLDALGALIWAAGLITTLKLVAGSASPPGLLFGALLAAAIAALLARTQGGRLTPSASVATAGGRASDWETGRAPARSRISGFALRSEVRAALRSPAFRISAAAPANPSILGVCDQRSAQP